MPDVVDGIHQRGHAFEAEAECEARINGRVNAAGLKDIRMDHSRTAEFDPARAFAGTTPFAFEFPCAVTFEAREIKLG